MMTNLLTGDGVTVGVLLFFSKNLSKTFPANGLNCWSIVHFFLTFHVVKIGSSINCLCGFYFESLNICGKLI